MKKMLTWGLVVLVLMALTLMGLRAAKARREAAPAVAATTPAAPVALELTEADLTSVRRVELTRSLEISGSVKAVHSAVIKARVAAEVRHIHAREGEAVRRGQLMVEMDPTELDLKLRQADQTASSARAQLDIARRALENNRALVTQGFISTTALDTSVANEAAAQANLQATQAAVDLARKARSDASLTAPLTGIVSQRLVHPGERVGVDARLVEIVDLGQLELEAAVAPEDLGALRIGAPATLQVDGVAQPVRARVARLNPSAQAGSRAVLAYFAIEGPAGLRQGLFARGQVELERRSTLAVPQSALRLDGTKPYVLAVADGRVVRVALPAGATGEAQGISMRAVDGVLPTALPEGTRLLAGAVGSVPEGTAVRLRPAPADAPPMAAKPAANGTSAR
jgi:RND family efflux transporter MFP subunit